MAMSMKGRHNTMEPGWWYQHFKRTPCHTISYHIPQLILYSLTMFHGHYPKPAEPSTHPFTPYMFAAYSNINLWFTTSNISLPDAQLNIKHLPRAPWILSYNVHFTIDLTILIIFVERAQIKKFHTTRFPLSLAYTPPPPQIFSWIFSLFHRAFQFTIYNGLTNALVCIKTLIQMSHAKTFKITPTRFDHQLIIIRELFDPG
jgi:hypothetical protein